MSNENKTVEEIFAELKAKQQAGYLLRGEPQDYDEVTSGLYRITSPENRMFIHEIEQERVLICLKHCGLKETVENALQKLAELQYHAELTTLGPTNLIDFTRCPYIALFFACDRDLESDGRIVMIDQDKIPDSKTVRQSEEDRLFPWGGNTYIRREIGYPPSRADAQKSVFIHCKNGILDKNYYKYITIPSEWKFGISSWLASEKKIDRRFIYPDTLGFLQSAERRRESLGYRLLADQELLKTRDYRYVIDLCRRSTNEVPHPYVYHIWGIAHLQLGEKQEAIDKFDRALKIDNWRNIASGNTALPTNRIWREWVATLTARNIAVGKRGEYPRQKAVDSLNNALRDQELLFNQASESLRLQLGISKEDFHCRRGRSIFFPDTDYQPPPDKRWQVLNVFYDYNELWDALPQLSEAELQMMQAFGDELDYHKLRCDELHNPLK